MAKKETKTQAKKTRVSYKLGLPAAIARKVEKTGYTRGAEKDTVYQNRVLRNNTVLIPISSWKAGPLLPPGGFQNLYSSCFSRGILFRHSSSPSPRFTKAHRIRKKGWGVRG